MLFIYILLILALTMGYNARKTFDPLSQGNTYPGIKRAFCIQSNYYNSEDTEALLCVDCWERTQPGNFSYAYGHVFLVGNPLPRRCGECNMILPWKQPILNCDKCISAYTRCIKIFRSHNVSPGRIILLIYSHIIQQIVRFRYDINPKPLSNYEPEILYSYANC